MASEYLAIMSARKDETDEEKNGRAERKSAKSTYQMNLSILEVSSMFILLVKWNPMPTLSPRYFGKVSILTRLNTIQDTAHQ